VELDIEALYRKYNAMVFRRCKHILHNEALALEAMQDVFVKLVENRQRLNENAPSSLLYTMATNHCLNMIRNNRRRVSAEVPMDETSDMPSLDQIASLDDPQDQIANQSVLDRLFRHHPDSTRLIAVLHYHDGMTLEEVAETIGMSVSGVRKRLRHLRESLKTLQGVDS